MIQEWASILIIFTSFLSLFLFAEAWHRLLAPNVELTRKFVHIGCGLIVSCFPWIFSSLASVLTLGLLIGLFLLVARKQKWFPSVFQVKRKSKGEVYYVAAILFLFAIAYSNPVFFFISVMVLTISDALAALLGSTYQRITYKVEKDHKSLEGSTVFFLSTFLIIHLPLLLMTDLDRAHCVMLALLIAFIVTFLEAICMNGFDNFIIPIATYLLLVEMSTVPIDRIYVHIGWQIGILFLLNLLSWKVGFLGTSGLLAGHLFLYGCYSLGNPAWLLLGILCLLAFTGTFTFLKQRLDYDVHPNYQVLAIFYITLIPTLILIEHNVFEKLIRVPAYLSQPESFYPLFLGALAGQLSIACYRLVRLYGQLLPHNIFTAMGISVISFLYLVPIGVNQGPMNVPLYIPTLIAFLSPLIYYLIDSRIDHPQELPRPYQIQAAANFAGVMIALPFYLTEVAT